MKNPYLVGDKIYLRSLETEDGPQLTPWFNDADMLRNMALYRPMTQAGELKFIQQINENPTSMGFGIALRDTDQLIGSAGFKDLDWRNRQVSFGIGIGEKTEWNKGHGTEATRLLVRLAFETLNLNRVYLHVFEFNKGAIRCYEKVGFRIEGRLRQSHFGDGRYWDTIAMAILRDEWQP